MDDGTGPWAWIAGLLGIGILIVVAFLLFKMISAGGGSPSAPPSASAPSAHVTVPNLVNTLYSDAASQAAALGLSTVRTATQASTTEPPDTVLTQDPLPGVSVPAGTAIKLTVAVGPSAVAVPDLRNMALGDAANALAAWASSSGPAAEAFDPTVPAGQIVNQDPAPGVQLSPGAVVNYTISQGPEPSPTPTPTPTPDRPRPPRPTPVPTPVPTPAPDAHADPGARERRQLRCMTQDQATTAIDGDGFVVGTVSSDPGGVSPIPSTWIVIVQSPTPGKKAAAGSPIDLTLRDPTTFSCTP